MPKLSTQFCGGRLLFFTVNLLEAATYLVDRSYWFLSDSVRWVRCLCPFHIDAWVVLPDHLHCIWTLPIDTDDFPVRWRLIKLYFPRACREPSAYPPHGDDEQNGAFGNRPPWRLSFGCYASKSVPDGFVATALLGTYHYYWTGLCPTYWLYSR